MRDWPFKEQRANSSVAVGPHSEQCINSAVTRTPLGTIEPAPCGNAPSPSQSGSPETGTSSAEVLQR